MPYPSSDCREVGWGHGYFHSRKAKATAASISTALESGAAPWNLLYASEFSNSFQFPISGTLSLSPGFNMFFFQDQGHSPGSSLVRRDLTLQLNYLFDWLQGIAWGDAIKGKSS
jgi:hypothetical protein